MGLGKTPVESHPKRNREMKQEVNEEVVSAGHENGDILDASLFEGSQDSLDSSKFPIPEDDPMLNSSGSVTINLSEDTGWDPDKTVTDSNNDLNDDGSGETEAGSVVNTAIYSFPDDDNFVDTSSIDIDEISSEIMSIFAAWLFS
ncbi:12068_t:CDS:2 [Acaulospora colombiana]|uniref:12068_t:CDS:1 n=1 Tax=Acaulospora colombiana TaxID=27376 RepID=A0ACA9LCN2_9GLOM|nr:12068_t:CDS:2 [Acaulospora colombiana]